ncbi:helix-turn-helix domain-containing protein [Paenibacillus sp. LHD-117]|uniref:helix-turn-helix domain-containing protein n=1 Tax=Paenibacillus sp. LHD-117 TaxID=3071412 RepID=UPI0027E0D883|nr:helix-turn-helix domain-containing protein [Paenibacillus sp. LHD-117]MDQ6422156.1 helix-turn-helix domain-containing protein [Paenibacillus sp. LHD-117]
MAKFQALIVDDEPLARLALREYISLTRTDIEISGEAGDGVEAMAFLRERQDIDIILADIQMPRMNGVELLTAVRDAAFPRQPLVIMLSAYSDYAYVRDSFVLGAFDYMLKAKLDEAYITPVLQKTVDELRRRQSARAETLPSDAEEEEEEAICAILHRLSVSQDAMQANAEQKADWNRSLDIVRMHVGEKNQEVAFIRLSKAVSFEDTHRLILQTIRSVTNKERSEGICHVCRYDDRHYTIFFTFPEQCSTVVIRRLTHTVLTDVQIRLRQFLNIRLSIGISDIANGMMQWNRLFQQAKRLSVLSYFNGYDHLYYPEADRQTGVPADKHDHGKDKWNTFKTELLKALTAADDSPYKQLLGQGFALLVERYPSSPVPIKSELSEMIWEAGSLISRNGISWEDIHAIFPHPAEQVRHLETWEETVQWVEQFLELLHEKLHPVSQCRATWLSPVVAKAKAIIEKHYDEEILLSTISEMVGVSESYLSKQFAKETGINFIPYLTNLRIEKAKQALENGLKIYDVAEKVGYVNPEHFSRIFKKVTGVSPIAYRKEYERRIGANSYMLQDA